MSENILFEINDFGAIKEAKLNIKKLNIIAGNNGSGKSTSSKLLYTFLLASSNRGDYLANNSLYNHFKSLIFKVGHDTNLLQNDVEMEELLTLLDTLDRDDNFFNESLKKNMEILHDIISDSKIVNKEKLFEDLKNIENLIEVNEDQAKKYFNVTNVLLNSEFNFSELKDYQNAKVHIHGEMNDCDFSNKINFKKNKIGAEISQGYVACLHFEDVVYMESPSIFEVSNSSQIFGNNKIPYHMKHLTELVELEKKSIDVFDEEYYHKIVEFQNNLNDLIEGKVYYNPQKRDFMFKQDEQEYSLKNTASGIKQIGILQILLENRLLKENSFLFIDEPEVNLHPEWQIKFAEILILMVKDLNIHMYINSHSPQFIEALEVFSGKHGLLDDTVFYLSEKYDDSNYSFKEIPRSDLKILYDNLGRPYDKIDEIRIENSLNGIY